MNFIMRRMKKNEMIFWIIVMIFIALFNSCKNFEVVSELDVHLYHLQNPKTKRVEVIVTEQKLEVGKFYRLKSIKQINLEQK